MCSKKNFCIFRRSSVSSHLKNRTIELAFKYGNTEIIGEGSYRDCYATQNPDLCVKRMKPNINKQYFGFNFNIDMDKYLKFKFGISDMNKFEFNQITKLPKTLKAYIPSIVQLTDLGLIMGRRQRIGVDCSISSATPYI